MPRESTIVIVVLSLTSAVMWTVSATLWSVGRELPAVTTIGGALARLFVWPAYLVWAAAALLLQGGLTPPNIWTLVLLVGGVLGLLLSLLVLGWARRA